MPGREQARFIVLEGLDGAGTTTQAAALAAALQACDLQVQLTAEPSDGPVGRVARAHVNRETELDPQAAALCFSADRADHLHRVVRPALASRRWVVCDRYLLSTLAYQGAEGVDRGWIMALSASFEVPDLTIFLDLPHDERARRMSGRGHTDRYEAPDLQEGIRDSYRTSIEILRSAGHRLEVLDGTGDTEAVTARVWAAVEAVVPRAGSSGLG